MLTSVLNSRVASNTDDVLCGEALQVGRELACFDVTIYCPSAKSRPQAAALLTGRPPACRYFNPSASLGSKMYSAAMKYCHGSVGSTHRGLSMARLGGSY